ncbi:4-alpha-glucanotransferase [Terriglobus sp. TAA 43]|uniref:4-alpha-glucanotransferase n=1 Tax=Terriglobus sp. TAA 43 TaxID=278961 RepID=UPI000648ED96|nr:4-alpha-glucanotransferase [Terriglobus sp. TAA 43]
MISERLSGVLLHVTSLPSQGGIGDFGPAAYAFVDFLAAGKQRLWQVLPLNPVGYGNSPYSAVSAFAGNPLLISLEHLQRDGWLYAGESDGLAGTQGAVDFARAQAEKLPLIERAAKRFLKRCSAADCEAFQAFRENGKGWLIDYARFTILRRTFDYRHWNEWPAELAAHDEAALEKFDTENRDAMEIEFAVQFLFMRQWETLRAFCTSRDIRVMGDMAIFVSYDSADVWANKDVFDLDEHYKPIAVSGVPPDYFSETGQRWGNPLYRWRHLEQQGFQWWIDRVKRQMELYDLLRLDHFRGFEAYWRIPAEEETAMNGEWIEAPGHALFDRLKSALGGSLPFIAEDLGVITDKVDKLRCDFSMPGMRVLQFGFAGRGAHLHLPHKYDRNTVCYTGTHDNNTTLGWWLEAPEMDRKNLLTYLGPLAHPNDCVWAMIRCAERSVASICIVPLQDLLHLGSEGRMNTPGIPEANWTWRYLPEQLHPDISLQLRHITEECDRDAYIPEEVLENVDAPPPPEALHDQSGEQQGTQPETLASA